MTPESFLRQAKSQNKVLGGVGPGLFFAKHLIKFTNRPIGLIPCPGVGTSIQQWELEKEGKKSYYGALMEKIATIGGRIKGVLWYQGESDAWSTDGKADRYEKGFLNLIDSFRRGTGNPELPFIYVQLGHFTLNADAKTASDWEKVREVQRRVSDARKNVYMVSAIDLTTDDAIHLSFEGQQRLGARLAEIALTEVYHQPGHGKPIKLSSIEVLQPDNERPMIRVHFSGVTGHLMAEGRPNGFELRPSGPGSDPLHMVYRVDFDPHDPSALILGIFHPYKKGEVDQLVYGGGMNPYVNITDEKDISVPAFGPVEVKPQ